MWHYLIPQNSVMWYHMTIKYHMVQTVIDCLQDSLGAMPGTTRAARVCIALRSIASSQSPFHTHHGWKSRNAPSYNVGCRLHVHPPTGSPRVTLRRTLRVQLSVAGGEASGVPRSFTIPSGDGDSQSRMGGEGLGVFIYLSIYLYVQMYSEI